MGSITHVITDLNAAASTLDRPRATALSSELIRALRQGTEPLPPAQAGEILSALRRKRFFAAMEAIADALIQTGQRAPMVQRQYAQALIDQGRLTAAASTLRALAAELRDDPSQQDEYVEARGLLGRVFKQQYVDAGAPHAPYARAALLTAIDWYRGAYDEQPTRTWHGINVVACLARASRDGVLDGDAMSTAKVTASGILAQLDDRINHDDASLSSFDIATALEACVALGELGRARMLAREYASRGDADAFELASTLRQLVEVWQLQPSGGAGAVILPILQGALLQRAGGFVSLDPGAIQPTAEAARMEAVFGRAGFQPAQWLSTGLTRARLVARLGTLSEPGIGTGFLVRGRLLHDDWGERWLLVTNEHVVSDLPSPGRALTPSQVRVSFEILPTSAAAGPYRVARTLWCSPRTELDTTVLELDRPVEGIQDSDQCEVAPLSLTPARDDRIYIIGHPGSRNLSYSLQDNLFLGERSPRFHYRTPTEPGSSGSPIFDKEWRLIGVHHAGSEQMPMLDGDGTYAANEGIALVAIRAAIASSPRVETRRAP